MVWRLARTPSGITMTAVWHPRRDAMITIAQPSRQARLEQRRRAAAAGIPNRRRMGTGYRTARTDTDAIAAA
jgi:hypothetical protein